MDFGLVGESPDFVFPIKLTNITPQTVTVAQFSTSCGCGKFEHKSVTLPPNTEITVDLHLDLTHRKADEKVSHKRVFETPFVCKGTNGQTLFISKITGQVFSPLLVEPQDLSFGRVSELRKEVSTKHIPVKKSPEVQSWKVKSFSEGWHAIHTSDGEELVLKAPEKITLGDQNGTVVLETILNGKAEPILSELAVKITIVPDIAISPNTIQMGLCYGERAYPLTATLISISGKTIQTISFPKLVEGLSLSYNPKTKQISGTLEIKQFGNQRLDIPIEVVLEGIAQPLLTNLILQYYTPEKTP